MLKDKFCPVCKIMDLTNNNYCKKTNFRVLYRLDTFTEDKLYEKKFL